MRKPFYIAMLIAAATLFLINVSEKGPAELIIYAVLMTGITAPMMLVLWLTLTVALKKKSPFGITFNCVAVSIMINGLLLGGSLALVHAAVEPERWANIPAVIFWIMSYITCTLGYWFFLGRIPKMKANILSGKQYYLSKKDPATFAKKLPDGLNRRNALYISLFMAALQQLYYYLVYLIYLDFTTPAKSVIS